MNSLTGWQRLMIAVAVAWSGYWLWQYFAEARLLVMLEQSPYNIDGAIRNVRRRRDDASDMLLFGAPSMAALYFVVRWIRQGFSNRGGDHQP